MSSRVRLPGKGSPIWLVAAAAAFFAGTSLAARSLDGLYLDAAPFYGHWDPRWTWRLAVPVVLGAALVVALPRIAGRARWRTLVTIAWATGAAWAVSLALVDGLARLASPLGTRFEYLAAVDDVGSPERFLSRFTADLSQLPTHVRSHPPGTVLVFWAMDGVGLGGPGWAAALVIFAGSSAIAAVLIATREVAGEMLARRAVPFLVLTPAAVWVATSADALFLGVSAWGVSLVVLASGLTGGRSTWLAAAGGAVLGGACNLAYGVVLVGAVPLAVLVARRRIDLLAPAALAGTAVVLLPLTGGFWWPAGLAATREQYEIGYASIRPYWYFVLSNLAAFAAMVGPGGIGGLARLRSAGAGTLVLGGLAAVAVADITGLSKGEVERIWLPFAPWVVVAAAGLERPTRWLTATAGTAVALQFVLRSPW